DNGLILAGARVYYAMARDGLFFRKIATTNRFRVPSAALVRQGIWTALLVLPRTVTTNAATQQVTYGNVYNPLLEYIVSADLVFYLLMVVAVIILRHKKPNAERPYRTWGYPIVPIISIVLSALLTIDLAWLAPATSGIGILIVLTGVPAYFLWRLRGPQHGSPVYRRRADYFCMPAKSKKQQIADGAAVAAKRGKRSQSLLERAPRHNTRS